MCMCVCMREREREDSAASKTLIDTDMPPLTKNFCYCDLVWHLWQRSIIQSVAFFEDVCVCVCVAVWCSGCVLGSGPWGPEFKPNSGNFSIRFSICLPPVHPAVIGYLAFAGMKIQGIFSWNNNGPGETSGAHTTCCEERPVLLRVPSPAPGALLARLTVPD